nr:hypothetical protein Iba_scaffold21641CG0090 [Ipomoea batatas]
MKGIPNQLTESSVFSKPLKDNKEDTDNLDEKVCQDHPLVFQHSFDFHPSKQHQECRTSSPSSETVRQKGLYEGPGDQIHCR